LSEKDEERARRLSLLEEQLQKQREQDEEGRELAKLQKSNAELERQVEAMRDRLRMVMTQRLSSQGIAPLPNTVTHSDGEGDHFFDIWIKIQLIPGL
tara:strand:- start:2644 stop:2934 length:291 start_codon:yes stop_codon:yes gene_type:complete